MFFTARNMYCHFRGLIPCPCAKTQAPLFQDGENVDASLVTASVFSSFINLTNTVVGAGVSEPQPDHAPNRSSEVAKYSGSIALTALWAHEVAWVADLTC